MSPRMIRALGQVGLLLAVVAQSVYTAAQTDAGELKPDHTVERELPPSESHRYKIRLGKDEFLQVRVESHSVAAILSLTDAGGAQRAQMYAPYLVWPRVLSFVARARRLRPPLTPRP